MAVRDEDFGSGLTLVEGDDGIWSSPEAAPACAPRDWRSECEREHARAERERTRADAAEARCEELRWAEVESRARAGSLKWQLDRSRSKLKAAVEETQEVRRTAKDALSLQAEVTRLEKLLSEASIEPTKHRPTSPADKARRRLRATLEQAENQKATIKSLRAERGELRKEVTRLNRELARLGKRLAREEQVSERHKETIRRQYDEDIQLRAALRRLRNQSDRVRSLTEEVFWLRIALDGAKAEREALKARLVKLRTVGATLSKLPSDEAAQLRAALRRSRRQKTTINVLSKENARLRRAVKGSRTRREASDAQLAKLRATRKSLSKSLRGADAELRRALRRLRRQKATIKSLSRENARRRKRAKASRNRIETLEVQLARLRATGAVLSRALFGRKSEKQETPRSGRPRGQQRGAPGHGRTQRPGLEERTEELKPPEEARVNEARLEHYDPGLERQTPAFDAAQGRLKGALDGLFAEAEQELAGLPDQAREGKALRSLVNHREGLCVFVDRPQVPLDNNLAERVLRGPAIGRRLSFGSDSENGARFTAVMYSVVGTLALNGMDVLRWLEAWLEACAKNAGRAPDDLSPWLPWSMSEERRRAFMAAA